MTLEYITPGGVVAGFDGWGFTTRAFPYNETTRLGIETVLLGIPN